jgi:hypothetical protein
MPQANELVCDYCHGKVCKHDHIHWLKMCSEARAEADAIAARWQYEREHPFPIIKVTYHGQAKVESERRLREELA